MPFIVEVSPPIGGGPPIAIEASKLVVRYPNGTPIFVASDYGPDGSIAASMAGMDDFNRMLQVLRVHQGIEVATLELPKPPTGARLIAGPRIKTRTES